MLSESEPDIVWTCASPGSGISDESLSGATINNSGPTASSGPAFVFGSTVLLANTGSIESLLDHAVKGGCDVRIDNAAGSIIRGARDALNLGNRAAVENRGTITGGDEGVQADDASTLLNAAGATITGGSDGVKLGDFSTVDNYGTILGLGDDGVQAGAGSSITNRAGATIRAEDEGINANADDVTIVNHGVIVSKDDGINVAERARIVNTGLIQATEQQDGIDLDSGVIINSGTIIGHGHDVGINFDPALNDSYVKNTGLIEGNIAIAVWRSDERSQTVVNAGTLRGMSGVALSLREGNDTLIIRPGSMIEGTAHLGNGNDLLEVESGGQVATPILLEDGDDTVRLRAGSIFTGTLDLGAGDDTLDVEDNVNFAGSVTFGDGTDTLIWGLQDRGAFFFDDAPEQLILTGPGTLVGNALLTIDLSAFSLGEHAATHLGLAVASAVQNSFRSNKTWAGAFASNSGFRSDTGLRQRNTQAGLVIGRRLGESPVSGFLTYGRGSASRKAADPSATQTAFALGLAFDERFGGLDASALAFAGPTWASLAHLSGTGSGATVRGSLIGLEARLHGQVFVPTERTPGFDLALSVTGIWHETDAYDVPGIAGVRVAERSASAQAIRLEAGMPFGFSGLRLRPFAAIESRNQDHQALTFQTDESAAQFRGEMSQDHTRQSLGLTLDGQAAKFPVGLRAEASRTSFGGPVELSFQIHAAF
ncbi:hypothetical protein [Aurantiacibacter rhizosphaerae]|uniref:Autotransporter domain-containing protein n=1 Tax=Aurantiacibacter rhizosphaerae TaxID=2691582 RepID=A0A844XHR2_9SPHN|nr:hypothetical protein [Aurantiacibacter rhizosphaerae]MWV29104.1 hypothetical protein [Aurantiacibacter rhizosphaerae]